MENKKLMGKILKITNEISKNRNPKSNYISLNVEFIQQKADECGVSFDEMVGIIEEYLKPKE